MIRTKKSFTLKKPLEFLVKAHIWADNFKYFCSLRASNIPYPSGTFPLILAAGAKTIISDSPGRNFEVLRKHTESTRDWLFGHFSYDLKNEIENLNSENKSHMAWPNMTFFQPNHILKIHGNELIIESTEDARDIYEKITLTQIQEESIDNVTLECDTSRKEYIRTVEALRNHIEEGDIYEINYCLNHFASNVGISPISLFEKLFKISPNPFSTLYKVGSVYALCASPERFIKKIGKRIISQPIKGTAQRGNTKSSDLKLKNQLRQSEKERAENMMIVDLVRNDLSKSCQPGSVKVDEMFGIYTFPQLHQMISTISGIQKEGLSAVDVIKNAFPMGSMTGAPKIKVMELIDRYESSKRGLFSGSIGYFTPSNDFDFNVVIRSLFYDSSTRNLSFSVGSAITYDSDPQKEYEECMLKVSAIMTLLSQ